MYYVPFVYSPSSHTIYIPWEAIILPCFVLLAIVTLFIRLGSLEQKNLRKKANTGKPDRPEHIILTTPTHYGKGVGVFDETSTRY